MILKVTGRGHRGGRTATSALICGKRRGFIFDLIASTVCVTGIVPLASRKDGMDWHQREHGADQKIECHVGGK